MSSDLTEQLLPLVALYPEIHYRFKFFPYSRYFRRQPEIIADAPYRLNPGSRLPVLLLLKDADRFPITLESVTIEADCGQQRHQHRVAIPKGVITEHFWQQIAWVELPEASPRLWQIKVIWQVRIGKRTYRFCNDNLPGISHAPLQIVQSGLPLPGKPGWIFGDLHVHTAYTEDQVEFGAPLTVYPALGQAAGFSFAFPADHSYDLDDQPGSFHKPDPELRRFQARSAEIDHLNEANRGRFAIIPGYELTTSNAQNKNVHLLLMNQRSFLPGSGDSAERWFRTTSELDISEALQKMDTDTLPIAAHPRMVPSRLERLLLRRGVWEPEHLREAALFGLQICNGSFDRDFYEGLQVWVEGLLKGRCWKIVAGSDAHGNFNRFRQVGFPMLTLAESDEQVFGAVWTGIYLQEELTSENLLKALRSNPSLISNGPFAEVALITGTNGDQEALIEAMSSPEFGKIELVKLLWGDNGQKQETVILREESVGGYDFKLRLPLQQQDGYLRMEVRTDRGKLGFTNPIYLKDS